MQFHGQFNTSSPGQGGAGDDFAAYVLRGIGSQSSNKRASASLTFDPEGNEVILVYVSQ